MMWLTFPLKFAWQKLTRFLSRIRVVFLFLSIAMPGEARALKCSLHQDKRRAISMLRCFVRSTKRYYHSFHSGSMSPMVIGIKRPVFTCFVRLTALPYL